MTDIITKCDSYFITKCDKSLLQNASGFLLQNAKVLLQNAKVITKYELLRNATFITSCDSIVLFFATAENCQYQRGRILQHIILKLVLH